jgi:hypothetical protein
MCFGTTGEDRAARAAGAAVRRHRKVRTPDNAVEIERAAQAARERRADAARDRERAIDRLVKAAVERGDADIDRAYWTMVHDFEMAPPTSGRAMLLEQGIVPLPPQEMPADADLHDELWTVLEGLAAAGVYLVHTDHLTDRDLYARLYYRILDEPTRCLPAGVGAAEFIDVLHPLDVDCGGVGKRLHERLLGAGGQGPGDRAPGAGPGIRGPRCDEPAGGTIPADRDRWLPRPPW